MEVYIYPTMYMHECSACFIGKVVPRRRSAAVLWLPRVFADVTPQSLSQLLYAIT